MTGKTSSHTVYIQQARMEGLVTPEKNPIQFLTQLDIGAVEPFSVPLIYFCHHKQADGANLGLLSLHTVPDTVFKCVCSLLNKL